MANFPKFEDWTAPWEKSGEPFDEARAKGLLYSKYKDEDGLKDKVGEISTERDQAKQKVKDFETKDETEAERLKRELKEAQDALSKSKNNETSIEVLQLRVALKKGLTERQAKRLVGKDEAELEADADDLIETIRGKAKDDGPDPEDDDDVRNSPGVGGETKVRRGGKGRDYDPPARITPEELAKQLVP